MLPRREVVYAREFGCPWVGLAMVACACASCSPSSDSAAGLDIAQFDYAHAGQHATCEAGKKAGAAGATDGLTSGEGVRYNVRAPGNYDPTFAHALLMVYPAGGRSAGANESLTHLTSEATRNGFVVAYPAHQSMSIETVHKLAKLPVEIADRWCVDLRRVYATGHSDGGTVSTAIALLDETKGTLAGIAPSAAGFSRRDFETFKCPSAPLPVMVMHTKYDRLFPGWGADAAKWWAACNGCDMTKPPQPSGKGCAAYQSCAAGGATRYCEGEGSHGDWPGLEAEIVRFFASSDIEAPVAETRKAPESSELH